MIISSTCPISVDAARAVSVHIEDRKVKEDVLSWLKVLSAPHSNLIAVELGRRLFTVLRPLIMAIKRKDVRLKMEIRAKERNPSYDSRWQ